MNLQIIDTHAHLDMPEFESDRDDVIKRASDNGVTTIVTVGIDLESSGKAIELAGKYPGVVATVGIHPQEASGIREKDIDQLAEMASHPLVKAIGEIGLDYYRDRASHRDQLEVLQWQLALARKTGLPIIIHCRQAREDMLNVIRDWVDDYKIEQGRSRGVIHCFSEDLRTAELYMAMGFFISLGAYIGYPTSVRLRDTIRSIPMEKLVIETDCPFLPPQKFRGKRNEPSYTLITLGVLAEIKQLSLEETAQRTTSNTIRLFNLARKENR